MGFDSNGVRLLIKSKQLSVNFDKVLCVGRQGLNLEKSQLQRLLKRAGLPVSPFDNMSRGTYAEQFLNALGASAVDSMDASDYENATIIHDLNLPVSNEHKAKYSLVIDGGSLEHIFNFPMAIKNCMEMIQVDGHYISITPTNNFLGHGFYQFSPELYYRIFNAANGFEIVKMYFYINQEDSAIYEVVDPAIAKQRVTLINSDPSYLFVIAKRIEAKPIFSQYPQQFDYEKILWEKQDMPPPQSANRSYSFIKKLIPRAIKNSILRQRPTGISNTAFFKKIEDI